MDVHGTLYPDQEVPQSLVDKRASVVEKFKELQAETDPVLRIFTEPEVTKQIQASRDSKQLLDFLVKGYDFKTSMIDTCYNFAKFQYECGNYSGASEYLYFHRILVQVSPQPAACEPTILLNSQRRKYRVGRGRMFTVVALI